MAHSLPTPKDHPAAPAHGQRLIQLSRGFLLATPSLAAVARSLGVSGRSLQRRLAEAGTTFAALNEGQGLRT